MRYGEKKYWRNILVFVLFCCGCIVVQARKFVHPGLLHTNEDLLRIRELAVNKVLPAVGSYELLEKAPGASFEYQIKGPFENISRAGKYGYTKSPCENDCNAAYYNALMWVITGDVRHASKAMEILRAYASTLQRIYGPDDPLCAGLQGFMLVNAAEIMRYTYPELLYPEGWKENDTRQVEDMFRRAFLPVLRDFCQSEPYANGNWGISVNKMRLALGIFMNDEALYDEAVDFFFHSKDNGSLPNYIAVTGQIQESGRDQAHCMLGMGCLAETAECAWSQGDDLYAALDNRIMKGYEYLSKVNLGYKDVPFIVWKDATGRYCNWQTMGEAGLGEFRAVFEIAYNHYVYRKGLEMPYTEKVVKRIRPEGAGFTCDNPGFGTLLFYLGKPEKMPEQGRIEEYLTDVWKGWDFAAPSLQPAGKGMSVVSPGIRMKKTQVKYHAGMYPYIEIKFNAFPQARTDGWFRLSYSVNSAPEFWTFYEKDAVRKADNSYVFKIQGSRSNNGTEFSSEMENVTLFLDFGMVDYVGVDYIISKNTDY
ncbi:MAG: alginate lyase family protein [Phocaeicola sp.]|uniref:alginate lyase family protein n=1 Tax=Phocaeicola sp. TaxID=2773926 RepID=UPI00300EECCD